MSVGGESWRGGNWYSAPLGIAMLAIIENDIYLSPTFLNEVRIVIVVGSSSLYKEAVFNERVEA